MRLVFKLSRDVLEQIRWSSPPGGTLTKIHPFKNILRIMWSSLPSRNNSSTQFKPIQGLDGSANTPILS